MEPESKLREDKRCFQHFRDFSYLRKLWIFALLHDDHSQDPGPPCPVVDMTLTKLEQFLLDPLESWGTPKLQSETNTFFSQ